MLPDDDASIIYAISNSLSWRALGVNLLGVVAIIVWSFVLSLIIFLPLKLFGKYRVDKETEFKGNDLIKHGESAYPRDAWVEMQVVEEKESPDCSRHMPDRYFYVFSSTTARLRLCARRPA